MKNTIILFFIMTAYLFPQGWNNTVTTTINEPNLVKMDLFANKDGNHIIVQNSNSTNSIKYYLLNSSGTVLRSSTIETSGYAEFPNISGDNDKVYLVYKLGNNLKANYTTNAGQSWNSVSPKAIGSNTCNGVDIVYDYQGLHVVYAMQDNGSNYETYYYKLNSSNSWVDYKNVTDYGTEVGGLATVTVSNNRVHVSYNTNGQYPNPGNTGYAKTRDKNGSNWEDPQTVLGSPNVSGAEKLQVAGSTLYDFYYLMVEGMGQFYYNLYFKTRNISQNQWSSETLLGISVDIATMMNSTSTYDQNAHIIYQDNGIYHKSSTNWNSSDLVSSDFLNYSSIGFTSAGNDLYTTWKPQGSSYIKYRQYDAAPLTPTNFAGTSYNNHPKLTWSLINGPDVVYEIHRKVSPLGEPAGTWQLLTSVSSATSSYVDNSFEITGQQLEGFVEYKVRAKDLQPAYSAFTNSVLYHYYGVNKFNSGMVREFSLSENYPNPFNPSTTISYSIPEKSFVTLKVYDMLGREVAELVNEELEAGSFEKTFEANALSSGVYIYRITATKDVKILFSESKQMLLIK